MTADTSVTLRLQPRPEAVASVRQALREACPNLPGHVLYDAELLTSEIVTNAVQHGNDIITIVIDCDRHNLVVAVADDSPGRPTVNKGAAADALGGRGMSLVDRMAAAWGCRPREDGAGKVVWFRIAI